MVERAPKNIDHAPQVPEVEYAVEVTHLYKNFGVFHAVSDLSFRIRKGEIFGLLGPNGSGKTTTLNMISGLSDPTSGEVRVFGLNPRKQSSSVRRLLGVVPQETALYEELSAERNLVFHAELFGYRGREKSERVEAMLELAQLRDRAKSRVKTFSGGMKRRLSITRALLHNPWLVYLDEPTLGVDVQSRNVIWDYILKMKQEGKSVLLTTNYLEEANTLCDRIAILDQGKLIAQDTPAALRARFGSSVLDLEVTGIPLTGFCNRLRQLSGVQGVEVKDDRVAISLASMSDGDAGTLVPQILRDVTDNGGSVRHMTLREPSLDEVFLSLTGKGVRD
ncbi:ABC transporter ATP-binding protein [Alicyclobacillus mengziensis]|uniref:ATP-binding cassette domain-containing protein n=1 Tax=Alicyclobacillus mengziensis TaxID=2931921 RepID=A0A9X7W260_9BACL|nr:ATP-binding cassette domain-containing protein [Alicyclobacillus mengziensis]QSO48870.1 ATP-binding cassette domain-containing protein [Alicyclobacillus mengziensis]